MQRSIVLFAIMAVIGLGCSAALADMDFTVDAIGDPGVGDSWYQKFRVTMLGSASFDRLAVEARDWAVGSGPFELPALTDFSPSGWTLTLDTLTLAHAAIDPALASNSLDFTANFYGSVPTTGSNSPVMKLWIAVFEPGARSGLAKNLVLNRRDVDTPGEQNTVWTVEATSPYPGRTPEPIPAPVAVLLGGIGLGLVGWLKRRMA